MEKNKEQTVWLIVYSDGKFVKDLTTITGPHNTTTTDPQKAEKCRCEGGCCAKKYAESYNAYCQLLGIEDSATAVPYVDTGKEIVTRRH